MARWRRLTSVVGLVAGAAAAGTGLAVAAEKIAVGRIRLRPDPAAGEPLGELRGRPLTVLASDGTALYAEICGPKDAPVTIVFSHGYTHSQDVWHYQRQALESRARLVFWDQRGHGRSGHSDLGDVSIDQLGSDLAEVLAATVPDDAPVVLVGHSMGGMTVMALAHRHPELFGTRVIGTLLISTAAGGVDLTRWLPQPLRSMVRQAAPPVLRGARGRRAALLEWSRAAASDLAFLSTRFLAFGDPGVSPTVVDFLERIIRATPVEVVAAFYLALVDHDKRGALRVLGRVPAVVLAGGRDRLVALRLSQELAEAIPGAEFIQVPGAGHVLILERPDLVNDVIIALVATALTRAGMRPRPA